MASFRGHDQQQRTSLEGEEEADSSNVAPTPAQQQRRPSDYQLQLRLLEQKNKKAGAMARMANWRQLLAIYRHLLGLNSLILRAITLPAILVLIIVVPASRTKMTKAAKRPTASSTTGNTDVRWKTSNA